MTLYIVGQLLWWITLGLNVIAIAIEAWALFDVIRRKPVEFERADKRTQPFWLGMCAGALLVGVLSTFGSLGPFQVFGLILSIAAVTASAVYLADVKPALNLYGNGGRPSANPRW
ncbi:DUF2516 family protein [Haematomicrobium sanguinis]|uniref:DUF2516 family protein n=1 Tax=Haematomicrobium sanguinis TaxID=479106 RepID=UPI00055862C0|nr:DUF2516 family protein [Haematomicrobium sanguinis]